MNTLLPNQFNAKAKAFYNKVFALFMKMGTGKTRVAVELVNAVENIDLVVYIAPLDIIKPKSETISSIKDEVNKWGGFNATEVVYIGIETIGMSDRQYLQLYKKISTALNCFLIVDESIKVKNIDAKRTKRVIEYSKMVQYKLILNGEPMTRDLLDLWSQFYILDPEILNMSLAEFKNTFCKYTTITKSFPGTYKSYTKEFITGYENIDYLYSLIGEYVYECDLELNVQQIYETANYSLSDNDLKTYNFLKETYLDNEKLMAMNNNIFLEMTQKMQHEYSCTNEKTDIVSDWFKTYPEEKAIIYCNYIVSAELCRELYPKALVLNYNSSFGHNLQDRPFTVYFDQTFDWGKIVQSSARNYRTGQENDCRYLRLVANVGLGKLYLDNNFKKLGLSEYLKKISKEKLKEIL
ncbi:hypothetical protein FCOL_05310 [Flavobacterium columnare ATCC 49512]|uniref:SNF2 N-terminal domain-containing protein n=1 Tax=Flavobacterium columnare (strain ATCC 49512 / CIP 103533 / TG 44/87) TaxID=1041826 RepID=G8X9E0_FLACA|nr:SNF2-related protein [Flavobacterium columnare]AEW85887.1 hypothetical protein FCOL_05310 [Flavobacterium columnare ATCC 49512]